MRAILLLTISISCTAAEACRRGTCHTCRSKIVKQFVQEQPVLVVQNNYPAGLVTAQGRTLYQSFQQQALPFFDPNQYLSSKAELLKAAFTAGAQGDARADALAEKFSAIQAPAIEKLSTGQAAAQLLKAAGFDPAHNESNSQGVILFKDKDGNQQVLPLNAAQLQAFSKAPIDMPVERPGLNTSALKTHCAKCHGLDVAQPKGEFFIGDDPNVAKSLREKFFTIQDRVRRTGLTGDPMPPTDIPDDAKAAVLDEIEQLILKHK